MEEKQNPRILELNAVVLDCRDPAALSDFYIRLLGWEKHYEEKEEWVDICSSAETVKIAFQRNDTYLTPTWPEKPGKQQQMVHLDFTVQNKEQMALAIEHAVCCGAKKAAVQYDSERWVTMIDPEGHPFCFVLWE